MMKVSSSLDAFSIFDLIKCNYHIIPAAKEQKTNNKYFVIPAYPATGVLYITSNNPKFIPGTSD